MSNNRSVERMAGMLLVSSIVAFLGHGVAFSATGVSAITIFGVFLYGLLVFLAITPVYLVFRSHSQPLSLVGCLSLAAHGLFIVLVCTLFMAEMRFAQDFASSGGATGDFVPAIVRALELNSDRIRTAAFLFLGIGLASLGLLIARSGAVARWIGWLGTAVGCLGFLTVLAGLFNVSLGSPYTVMIGVFLMILFILILGVRLAVRETGQEHA